MIHLYQPLSLAQTYQGDGKVWLDGYDLNCSASASTFSDCSIIQWGSNCFHTDDAWVNCDGNCPSCINQTLPTVLPVTVQTVTTMLPGKTYLKITMDD